MKVFSGGACERLQPSSEEMLEAHLPMPRIDKSDPLLVGHHCERLDVTLDDEPGLAIGWQDFVVVRRDIGSLLGDGTVEANARGATGLDIVLERDARGDRAARPEHELPHAEGHERGTVIDDHRISDTVVAVSVFAGGADDHHRISDTVVADEMLAGGAGDDPRRVVGGDRGILAAAGGDGQERECRHEGDGKEVAV